MQPQACLFIFAAIPLWILSSCFLKKAVAIANDALRLNRQVWDEGSANDPPRLRRPIARPTMGLALLIVFISWVFVSGAYVSVVLSLAPFAAGAGANLNPHDPFVQLLQLLIAIPGSFLLRAGIAAHLLVTTFNRGCLIILICDLIQFAVIVTPTFALLLLAE
jgi:hypothetical protein